jgi:ADP-heptose:LPS heptosyltransferase
MSERQPGFLSAFSTSPRKIALVRPSRIGDFVCASPALRALKAGLPGAEIAMITLPMFRDLVERLPYIDRFIEFPGYPGLASQFFEARKATRFFEEMQAENFDLAIQLQGSGVYSNPFTLMLGAKKTVGFLRPGDPRDALDGAITFPQRGHEVERLLAMIDFLDLPRQGTETEFPLLDVDLMAANKMLAGSKKPLVGIHPAAHSLTRRWPLDRFAQVARTLRQRTGGTLVILAGPGETGLAAQLERMLAQESVLNLAGKTSLMELGGVIKQLDVLVTNDSGPAHISYALRIPTVTIWGGEDLERYGPPPEGPFHAAVHPIDCRPCTYEKCPIGYVCLENVSVEEVFKASEWVMRKEMGV